MRILIAEDDFTSRSILGAILKKWGYDPVVCEDGNGAWDVLQRPDAPELVLLDWNMPGMEGLEVCRRLRKIESSNPSYVILLTGRGEKAISSGAWRPAPTTTSPSPIDNEELQARIGWATHAGAAVPPAGSAGRPGASGDARSPDRHPQPSRHPGPAQRRSSPGDSENGNG